MIDTLLYESLAFTTHGKIQKISGPMRNEEFELPDKSYYVSDIKYYFKYIIKNMKQCVIMLQ